MWCGKREADRLSNFGLLAGVLLLATLEALIGPSLDKQGFDHHCADVPNRGLKRMNNGFMFSKNSVRAGVLFSVGLV